MPTTEGMKGGGYYDAHSNAQRSAMDVFLPWIVESVPEIPVENGASFDVLDIGSSEGANAIHALGHIVAKYRTISDGAVRVLFDDLPTNDFNRLFSNLFPGGSPVIPGANIFVGAIGGSAFGQLVPSGSLQVATTFNAIGFLESKPDAPMPNFILPMPPGPHAPRETVSVTVEEQNPFRLQADKDLHRFYEARAREITTGGRLLIQVFGRQGDVSTSHGIYDVLSDALLDAVEDEILPDEIYRELVFPIYFRTVEELVAPLEAGGSLSQSFEVEKAKACEVPVPFNALLESGDLAGWASAYTGFLRAFTESILAAALPEEVDAAGTLDAIYQRVETRLSGEPSRYPFHFISIAALLRRL